MSSRAKRKRRSGGAVLILSDGRRVPIPGSQNIVLPESDKNSGNANLPIGDQVKVAQESGVPVIKAAQESGVPGIAALGQGRRGETDGVSMLQTAEAGDGRIAALLLRMQVLAFYQASSAAAKGDDETTPWQARQAGPPDKQISDPLGLARENLRLDFADLPPPATARAAVRPRHACRARVPVPGKIAV